MCVGWSVRPSLSRTKWIRGPWPPLTADTCPRTELKTPRVPFLSALFVEPGSSDVCVLSIIRQTRPFRWRSKRTSPSHFLYSSLQFVHLYFFLGVSVYLLLFSGCALLLVRGGPGVGANWIVKEKNSPGL